MAPFLPRLYAFVKRSGFALGVLLAGPALVAACGQAARADWRTASRDSVGLAPSPDEAPQAIVQVYGARAVSWRGAFGVHTWIAVKPANAPDWTTYQIIGWRARWGGDALAISSGQPDRRWFGAEPELYAHLEGDGVDAVIKRIVTAVEAYPYRNTYTIWPGPNSNTFTAMVARAAPELRLDLPSTAIGKDYLGGASFAAATPSGTGYQFSLWGLLGVSLAAQEGLEINVAGLTFGIDPLGLAIKAPGIGRIGASADPRREAPGGG